MKSIDLKKKSIDLKKKSIDLKNGIYRLRIRILSIQTVNLSVSSVGPIADYSHSIVDGGFDEMSSQTRFTPFTLFIISLDTFAMKS